MKISNDGASAVSDNFQNFVISKRSSCTYMETKRTLNTILYILSLHMKCEFKSINVWILC